VTYKFRWRSPSVEKNPLEIRDKARDIGFYFFKHLILNNYFMENVEKYYAQFLWISLCTNGKNTVAGTVSAAQKLARLFIKRHA
jgi:hypothetical protein